MIVAIAGSLRADSYNRRALLAAIRGAESAGATVRHLDLREYALPIFDEDLEKRDGLPANARRLKDALIGAGGILIASPEYNSSISAVLKNMIDWASRPCTGPDGKPEPPLAAFKGKVCGVMSASPGALGGLRGLVHLRAILGNIGAIVLPDQIAVGRAHEAFDEQGQLKDAAVRANVEGLGRRVAELTRKVHS